MTFGLLVPLGLIALLTIPVLILIYLLKPNYQVKHVSSTYVWQLSLKYRKRRIPINRLRNILIFLCQILILTAIALIIARPAMVYDVNNDRSDVIAIIDSSASMYAESPDADTGEMTTRFRRAVKDVMELSESVLSDGGAMTVILADETPEYLGTRVDRRNASTLMDSLQAFYDDEADSETGEDTTKCSYGTADIDRAVGMCEEILAENPAAKIYLYTDTTYNYVPDTIEVVSVMGEGEWNAAILNAEAELDNGYYMLTVEVACYGGGAGGMALTFDVNVQVMGANSNLTSQGTVMNFKKSVDCSDGKPLTVIFRRGGGEDMEGFVYLDLEDGGYEFTSYQSISITIDQQDSFHDDNSYQIYGGRKPIVNILYTTTYYTTTYPNPFVTSALDVLSQNFSNVWDFRIREIQRTSVFAPFVTEGYDLYIFEHQMPDRLPTDGVVLLFDPDKAPAGSGFTLVGIQTPPTAMYLSGVEEHPILQNIIPGNISVTRYSLLAYDESYKVLLSCDTNPLLLVRNEGRVKTLVMPFSVHYSNITVLPEWYIFLHNTVKFFIPGTVEGNSFEVGEPVIVTPRGPSLTILDATNTPTISYTRDEEALSFTVSHTFDAPGVYTLEQGSYFDGSLLDQQIFVKIPALESNIWREEDSLVEPIIENRPDNTVQELLLWFAAALVTLLFIEWLLQSRENK